MNAEQKRNLEQVCNVVKSNYASLEEVTVIGRIGLITGKKFSACLKGYEMMKKEGLIDEKFINADTKGILGRLLASNPVLVELFDRLDCSPIKITTGTPITPLNAKSTFQPLPVRRLEDIIETIKVPKFE